MWNCPICSTKKNYWEKLIINYIFKFQEFSRSRSEIPGVFKEILDHYTFVMASNISLTATLSSDFFARHYIHYLVHNLKYQSVCSVLALRAHAIWIYFVFHSLLVFFTFCMTCYREFTHVTQGLKLAGFARARTPAPPPFFGSESSQPL